MYKISSALVFIFISFSMLGTIKIYIGANINWLIQITLLGIATIFALLASPLSMMRTLSTQLHFLRNYKLMMVGWLLFMSSIGIAAVMNNGVGGYTLAKYGLFIFVLICLILTPLLSPSFLEKMLVTTLAVSLVPLLFLTIFRYSDSLVILADGRMGWLASWPGVIWKIGAFIWPFAVWRCFREPKWLNIWLAFGAVLTMALDGSRTAILWIVIVWIVLTIIALLKRVQIKPIKAHGCLLVVTLLSYTLIQPILLGWAWGHYDDLFEQKIEKNIETNPSPESSTNHSSDTDTKSIEKILTEIIVEAPTKSVAKRIIEGEKNTRLDMLRAGWQQAMDKFPLGGGFGSTRVVETGTEGVKSTIHMTYLQLLADGGVLSLIGYLMFLLIPSYRCMTFVLESENQFAKRFELMLPSLSIISLFLLSGFFHPLSNELSEWAIVLTAIATIIRYVAPRN